MDGITTESHIFGTLEAEQWMSGAGFVSSIESITVDNPHPSPFGSWTDYDGVA